MKTKDERLVDLFTSLESNKLAMVVEQLFDEAVGEGYSFIELYYENYENLRLLESIVDSYEKLGYNINRLSNKYIISIY